MDFLTNLRPTYAWIESQFFLDLLLKATKGVGQCGSDPQFYAQYPGELFDELVHALVQLYEPSVLPRGDAEFEPFVSALNSPASWWTEFKSLQPSCPIDINVFVRFKDAWWGIMWPGSNEKPDATQKTVRQRLVEEIVLLGVWLTATGIQTKRLSKKRPAKLQPPNVETATHSENYDSVGWFGTAHTFTTKQATVIKALWTAWKAGRPSVLGVELIDAAQSSGTRVRDIFKSGNTVHAAWGTMIIKAGKSHYRLFAPNISESQ